ncbi:C component of insecticidal toxin complex [Kosakonia pseudosacchari]|uniref:C component of insecticidal toxin complex n=1 Tax=Kosakonia pseudosacchari TaxID=1646340 RepID=A0ABX4ITN8_9ENTR|nr:C component of insecticidal toxin complex [Kosakonia pseudosacchari]
MAGDAFVGSIRGVGMAMIRDVAHCQSTIIQHLNSRGINTEESRHNALREREITA